MSLPPVEQIAPGTWAIPLPLPIAFPDFTFCYLLVDADGGAHLIDPGWDDDEGRAALVRGLQQAGVGLPDVRSIVVTHLHADHLGLAVALKSELGVPIVVSRIENAAMDGAPLVTDDEIAAWGVPPERLAEVLGASQARVDRPRTHGDVLVEDGDRLPIPGRDVQVLLTPGHTLGHVVVLDHGERLVFTGDHVLPGINPGLGLGGRGPNNPISDYLQALDRVAAFDGYAVCPGHEYRFTALGARCTEIGDHHRRRTAEVAAAVAAHPDATVWELARSVAWTYGWDALTDTMLLSALSQIAMHRDLVTRSGSAPSA